MLAAKTLTVKVHRTINRRLWCKMYRCLFSAPRNLNIYKNPSNFIVFHDFLKLWVLSKLCHRISPHDLVLSGFKLASVTCVSSEIGVNPTFLWTCHFLQISNGFWTSNAFLTGELCFRSANQWSGSIPVVRTFSLLFLIRSVHRGLGQYWFHAGNNTCAVSGQVVDRTSRPLRRNISPGFGFQWVLATKWWMWAFLEKWIEGRGWNLEFGQPSAGRPPGGQCMWSRPVYRPPGHLT